MITRYILFCILFMTLGWQPQAHSNEDQNLSTITLGFIPGGNPEAVKSESLALAQALSKKMNLQVNVYISKNYEGLIDALKMSKVDYAFLTPQTYVLAEKQIPLKVLLKKTYPGPFYYSSLVVLKKSPIKKISDLKNKKMGFVDIKSGSGYLYPLVYLRKNKMTEKSFSQIIMTGNHSASIEQLENKKLDVAAVFSDDEKGTTGAWNRFKKNPKSEFRILWVSEPIPNDPLVVRLSFYEKYPKLTHELMYNLIELQNDQLDRKAYSEVLGIGDLMPATSKQYDPVREMNKLNQE